MPGAAPPPAEGQTQPGSTPAPKTGTQTVVDKKILKVTLMIHSIRLNPLKADKAEKKTPKPVPGEPPPATPPSP